MVDTSALITATADITRTTTSEAILRARLEAVQGYHDSLLNTVYWALSTVGGFTLALITVVGIFYYRVSDRERRALHDEIENQIGRKTLELDQSFDAKKDEVIQASRESAKSYAQSLDKNYTREIENLKSDMHELEAFKWRQLGVPQNEVTSFLRAGEAAQRGRMPARWSMIADDLEEALGRCTHVSADVYNDIANAERNAPDEVKATLGRIRQLAERKQGAQD